MEIGKLKCKQMHRFDDAEMISQLVSMLYAQDDESIETALFALLNLAFGSERNKVRIAKCGAIPALVEILQWRKEYYLVELAVATLLVLSSCTANKPQIGGSGAVQILLQLLDSQFAISHQAKLDIISTLHNLSTSIVISADCFISLLQLVCASQKSSELVEKALGLLESIVSTSDIALNQICEMGGVIGMLVEAVEEGTGPCKEHAAGLLVLICKSSKERYKAMILSEGAMPGLLQLSVDGTRRARDSAKALLLMLRDNSNSRSKSNHSRNALLEEMMREIDRVDTSIQLVEETIAKLRS